MKKGIIIATSTSAKIGDILPMKENPKMEATKSKEQQQTELCNFIKSAFCVDGEVSMIYGELPQIPKLHFLLKDSRRGEFRVTMG